MLYFKALFDGLDAMPAADPAVRAAARRRGRTRRLARAARRAGARSTPPPPRGWRPNDASASSARSRSGTRSGRPLSQLSRAQSAATSGLAMPPPPVPRAHGPRLAARAHRRSASTRCWPPASRRSAGPARARRPVAELPVDALRRLPPGLGALGRRSGPSPSCARRGIAATRQLAKRQLTWLRSMPRAPCDRVRRADAIEQLVRQVVRRCRMTLRITRSGQALRRRAGVRARVARASRPASSSRSSASRASASRRCSTASPGSTAGTPARVAHDGSDIGALDAEQRALCGAASSASCSRPSMCCRTWTSRRTSACR